MACVYALRFNKLLCNNNNNNQTNDRNIPTKRNKPVDHCFRYDFGKLIGEGTFGQVFEAKHAKTLQNVAIKLIKCKSDKIEVMVVNEIKLLKMMKHSNIIKFNEHISVIEQNGFKTRYLVFEYCDYDLCQLLCHPTLSFSLGEVKNILYQFFDALSYIHQLDVIHRDLKPANILLTKTGKLKVADFGLAISLNDSPSNGFSTNVVTLAYRPPELLLGQRFYDTSVDMWSAGCIMAEMWTRTPVMLGFDEYHQLMLISQLCGSLNLTTRQLSNLNVTHIYPRQVKEMLLNGYINDLNAADLLDQLLSVNPSTRISAKYALKHSFFMTEPKPCDISDTLMNFDDHYYNNENIRSL